MKSMSWLAAVAGLLLAQAAAASAAEIKVYSTIGVKGVLEDLVPKFEKQTGNKLNMTWGTDFALLTKRAQEGERPTSLIVITRRFDNLTKDGKIAARAASRYSDNRSSHSASRHGAPKPDIPRP